MSTAAPLVVPVKLDGRTAVASLEQIQAAANQAREAITDQIAGSARLQAEGTKAAAELERRRIALVLQGIEDTTERRVASINLTAALEAQAVEKLIQTRLKAGEITKAQAAELREEFDRVAEAARTTQIGSVERGLGGVQRQGRNAGEAVVSLARGLEDASFAGGNFAQIVRFSGNNVSQFVTQLGYARAEAAAVGKTVGGTLVASLAGPAGLVLALSLAQVATAVLSERMADAEGGAGSMADQMGRAADEAIRLQLETDNLTISKLEEAEAYKEVLASQVELIEQGIRRERQELTELQASSSGVERSFGILKRRQDDLRASIAAGTTNLEFYRGELSRVSEELRLFELRSQAVERVRGQRPGIGETDSERRQREEAEREAERARQRAASQAAAAARREERRRQTAARQQQRREDREATQAARQRAELRARLQLEGLREGFDQEKEQLRLERGERLRIAGRDAQLRLAVEAQYQRDLTALRAGYAREVVDRERANLAAVAEAREAAYDTIGRSEEEAAAATIERIRRTALEEATFYAERVREAGFSLDSIEDAEEALAEVVRTGTLAQAERLAVIAAQSDELRPLLDLLLQRIAAEAQLAAAGRARRIEVEALAREERAAEREREDRRAAAERTQASGGRLGEPTGEEEAEARLRRAQAALDDIDVALARVAGTAGEVVVSENGATEVIVEGVRIVTDEVQALADRRRELASEVADAEVAAAEAAAEQIRQTYEDRLDAAESYADGVLDALEAELTRQRRYSDAEVEITRERYAAEERDLLDSLRRRQTSQEDYDRDLRELRADRAQYEREVAEDERDVLGALLTETLGFFVEAAKREAAAQLAPYIADYFKSATRFFGFLGPGAPFAAAATIPAAVATFKAVVPGFATGGRVDGPGGPTEDRIPALLSAGEHVLTAREVVALGGHAAVERFRQSAILGTVPRFATGGPVLTRTPFLSRAPLPASTPSSGGLDLSPVLVELRATRLQLERQGDEIARLKAGPVLVGDSASRRIRDTGAQTAARTSIRSIQPVRR